MKEIYLTQSERFMLLSNSSIDQSVREKIKLNASMSPFIVTNNELNQIINILSNSQKESIKRHVKDLKTSL